MEKRKISCPFQESNPDGSVCSPVTILVKVKIFLLRGHGRPIVL
jgi:hypothetical protein